MLRTPELLDRELEYQLENELEWESEPGIEYAVIGPRDDRFPILARRRRPSSLLFPTNTICFLEIVRRDGSLIGTGSGTLIAPQVVLTAKHVLMDVNPPRGRVGRAVGPLFPRIRVTPGTDLSAATEHFRRPATPPSIVADSARFRVDPNLDYGVIILPTPFRAPSRFMMLQPRSALRTATLLTIAGYPCDKRTGTMWGHSGHIPLTRVTTTHLFYTIDTCPGHSGSPIWLLGNNEIRLLLGIHTSGPDPATSASRCDNDPRPGAQCRPTGAPVTPVSGENAGVRVTCHVIDTVVGWCRQFGVPVPKVDWAVYRRRCPASGVAAPARPTLRRGARGSAVQTLQTRLNVWILRTPDAGLRVLAVDGVFGASTEAAIRVFQASRGLSVDGVVGQQTWNALPPL